jgi:hypothetical protein
VSLVSANYEINALSLSISVALWAVVPGVALALGALPFLREGTPRRVS